MWDVTPVTYGKRPVQSRTESLSGTALRFILRARTSWYALSLTSFSVC